MTARDADGKSYLDFTSGIGVNSLGYCHPAWVKAVAEQAVGELLFTAAALARQAGVDPEQALQKRNAAFLAEHTGRAENQES